MREMSGSLPEVAAEGGYRQFSRVNCWRVSPDALAVSKRNLGVAASSTISLTERDKGRQLTQPL